MRDFLEVINKMIDQAHEGINASQFLVKMDYIKRDAPYKAPEIRWQDFGHSMSDILMNSFGAQPEHAWQKNVIAVWMGYEPNHKEPEEEFLSKAVDIIDLGEQGWQDYMKTKPTFKVGTIYVFKTNCSMPHNGEKYCVSINEKYGPHLDDTDLDGKGLFWSHDLALRFAKEILTTELD